MVISNNFNKAGVGGGSKILSRIQKSVKEFMGHSHSHSESKKGKLAKKNLGKKGKTAKRFIPIIKNKKTNKVLYRIKQSVKEFSNV